MTHIFFDLDGTLVDSFPGIEFSARSALSSVCPGVAAPDFRPFIGPPIREVFCRALAEEDAGTLDHLEQAFRTSYDADGWRRTQTYPGVGKVLAELRAIGLVCHVLTNKPQRPTHEILRHLSLDGFFDEVITPDSRTPKYASKTEAALEARRRHGLAGPETLLVGDSPDDGAAADACGFQFAAACFGYGNAHRECASAVHFRLECFADLLSTVRLATRIIP